MPTLDTMLASTAIVAWPAALLLAWAAGELCARIGIPRVSAYAVVGIIAAPAQFGWLTPWPELGLLADIAFGLLLFELGYRVNLRWFTHNHWLGIAGLIDAAVCFIGIYAIAVTLGMPSADAALLGALGMASSPAALVRVMHDEQAGGQIAERMLHLALLGCVLAVVVFKATLGFALLERGADVWHATFQGGLSVLLSAAAGVLFGVIVTAVLRALHTVPDATMPYALSVVCLVTGTHALGLSPIVATLALGLTTRHRRVVFGRTTRGFGALGDTATVLLFVYLGSRLDLAHAASGFAIGMGMVAVRLLVTPTVMALTARPSGITMRKGALTGLGLMPLSAFVLMMLEQSASADIDLFARLAPLAAAAVVLDVAGPACTRLALRWGGEGKT